jgi:hypothetical protein
LREALQPYLDRGVPVNSGAASDSSASSSQPISETDL